AELDALTNVIATSAWPIEWVEAAILGTPEFYARRGSTAGGFVDGLYSLVLGLTPSAADRAYWVDQVANKGLDRTIAAVAFTTSSLEQSQLVTFAYTTFLHRAADSSGLTFWTNQLATGLRTEYMDALFVGCAEYFSKV